MMLLEALSPVLARRLDRLIRRRSDTKGGLSLLTGRGPYSRTGVLIEPLRSRQAYQPAISYSSDTLD